MNAAGFSSFASRPDKVGVPTRSAFEDSQEPGLQTRSQPVRVRAPLGDPHTGLQRVPARQMQEEPLPWHTTGNGSNVNFDVAKS